MVSLETFITELFHQFIAEGVKFCVLRNYERLPEQNVGGDVDILVAADSFETAAVCVSGVAGTRLTGVVHRGDEHHLFLDGVRWSDDFRAIQVDLVTGLTWKGLPYMSAREVLARSRPIGPGSVVPIPDPRDEAMITFLASYLAAGEVKARYRSKMQTAFGGDQQYMESVLVPFMDAADSAKIVSAVAAGEIDTARDLRRSLVRGIVRRSLADNPIRALGRTLRYYRREALITFTPRYLTEIHLVGGSPEARIELAECLASSIRLMTRDVAVKHAGESGLRLRRFVPLHRNSACWIWATSPLETIDGGWRRRVRAATSRSLILSIGFFDETHGAAWAAQAGSRQVVTLDDTLAIDGMCEVAADAIGSYLATRVMGRAHR